MFCSTTCSALVGSSRVRMITKPKQSCFFPSSSKLVGTYRHSPTELIYFGRNPVTDGDKYGGHLQDRVGLDQSIGILFSLHMPDFEC